MKAHRLFKCQLCGKLYKNVKTIDIQNNEKALNDVIAESFHLGQVCFCEDGRIGFCLFSGFEEA